MGDYRIFLVLCLWLVAGLLSAILAKKRGRHPLLWFLIGLFFSFTGILFLFVLPKINRTTSQPEVKPPSPPRRTELWLKLWYYLDADHKQQGPIELPDLINKWKQKEISDHSFIWGEEMAEWKRLSDLPELLHEFRQA